MTLSFLGEVLPERLADVEDAARRSVSGMTAFNVSLEGIGAFPDERRPQVIWAGVSQGADALSCLAARLKGELSDAGFPQEERPWKAHLTLARSKPGSPRAGF